jgi:hypothetical protein
MLEGSESGVREAAVSPYIDLPDRTNYIEHCTISFVCACNSDSKAESSGSLPLYFAMTTQHTFNGFARRSEATALNKGFVCFWF